jgi:uncharacterized protein
LTPTTVPDKGSSAVSESARQFAISRGAPFAVLILCIMVEQLLLTVWPQSETTMQGWFYPVRALVTGAVILYYWRQYTELRPFVQPLSASLFGQAAALGAIVIVFWIAVGPMFRLGAPPNANNPIPADQLASAFWLACRFAGTAIIVPIAEELFWRSFIMRRLDSANAQQLEPARVSLVAMIASSAVFALEHREWLAGFVAGFAFAWLYRRTADLRYSVIAHSVANALLFVYVVLFGQFHFWG